MRVFLKPIGLPLAVALAAPAMVAAAPGAQTVAGSAPTATAAASAATMVGRAPLVQINTGRGRLVTLARPMSDLFVADDGIADVQVRSPTQLYIFGKKTGETTVSATTKGGQVVYAATVRVGNNLDSIGSMLRLAMPEAKIVATPMNGLVLLTGTVAAPEDAAEAERLAQAFVGEDTKVLSRLKTATPLQVNLQVRFVEISRNFSKDIGINLLSRDSTGGFQFGIGSGRPAGTFNADGSRTFNISTTARTTLGLSGKLLGLDLLGAIDLGEATGQATTLATPNLTALSGETGTFLAGGEVPIPIAQGLGAVTVEYKQYGVSLAYTPTVLSDGRISLRVRPEVSQLDYANAVPMGGTRVPGITTRRAETTLELGSGQSMMIGGLLQNLRRNNYDKTPFLSDLPILGALFRSNSFQRNETELVIVITPYLVKPVNNAADIIMPADGERAATDLGRTLFGRLDGGVTGEKRPGATISPARAPVAAGIAAPAASVPPADRRRDVKPLAGKGAAVSPGFSN